MVFALEKKMLMFFVGVVIIAAGITRMFQSEFFSVLVIFLGVYLMIKGLT
mgnify:CR=1 FL=1